MMDVKRATEVLDEIKLWPGMPFVEEPRPRDFDEAISFIRAALKAQAEAEPVYQYLAYRPFAGVMLGEWKEVTQEVFDEFSSLGRETRTLYTAPPAAIDSFEAVGWMPIESAPRDGTAVLVSPGIVNGKTCSIARYNTDNHVKRPRPYWDRDDAIGVFRSRENPPSHWMPLPAPGGEG